MRLRGRFTLWFALAALVPIAAAAAITREVVSQSYTDEFARIHAATEKALERELARLEGSVTSLVSYMFEAERHDLVGGVLVELEKSDGQLGAQARQSLERQGRDYRRGFGLDVLFLVDASTNEVLVAPHYHSAQYTKDPVPAERARALSGKAYYVREPTIQGDQIAPMLVVESARAKRQGRYGVAIVAGKRVDRDILESVLQPGRINARIVDEQGRVLIAPKEPWQDEKAATMEVPLPGPEGEPAAVIEVAISTAELERVLRQVTAASLILAVIALCITVLLGVFVARRMTLTLDRVVEGAQAAARGDLGHRVTVNSNDEIGAVAKSINLMMEDLKTASERLAMAERVAAWQEIARRLAHEIKNPLTPIQMAVETLRKTWKKKHPSFEEIFEESTATVLEETARLKRIVGEFSQFARLPKPVLVPCDLSDVVAGSLSLYQEAIPITRHLERDLPTIRADRDQLAQILLNLLENARDALQSSQGAEEGRIVVTTRLSERGDAVELVVEDSGPGIPDHIKDKLFTPYFTTKEGGTGLGLAIVHRLVSEHGGTISAGEAPAGGARLVVSFPVSRPPTGQS